MRSYGMWDKDRPLASSTKVDAITLILAEKNLVGGNTAMLALKNTISFFYPI